MLIAHGSFHILMSHGFHCSRQTRWLAPKPHSTLLLMVDRTDWQGRSVFASLAVNRDFELPAVRPTCGICLALKSGMSEMKRFEDTLHYFMR
jgi:hypothetical protein